MSQMQKNGESSLGAPFLASIIIICLFVWKHAFLSQQHPDDHRHEKISNIIKQFKLTAYRQGSLVQSMEVTNSRCVSYT